MPTRKLSTLLIAAIIIIVGVTSYFISKGKAENNSARDVVVLNNGQTYFGYLSDTDKPFVTLRSAFYPKDPSSVKNTNSDVKRHISLFEFGDEIFGPEPTMRINREDIVYYATMRADSKINTAINEHESGTAVEDTTSTSSPSQ